jgi:hypothetical protein
MRWVVEIALEHLPVDAQCVIRESEELRVLRVVKRALLIRMNHFV